MPEDGGDLKVRFSCPCGKRYSANPNLGGKAVTCQACGAKITVPSRAPNLAMLLPCRNEREFVPFPVHLLGC